MADLKEHKVKMPIIVTSDLLVNQLKRDSLRIADSFDALCDADVKEISELLAESAAIIFAGLQTQERENKELQVWSCEVLLNIVNSLSAAVYVLRAGYLLIPGVILRNAFEVMAVCIHGLLKPEDLTRIKAGDFDSPKAITTAKRIIPPFGEWYGFLSNQFAHAGPLHHSIQPLVPYKTRDGDLLLNLSLVRLVTWMLYLIVEFAFIDLVPTPRYWRLEAPNKAVFNPSEIEQQWLQRFLHGREAG